MFVHIFFKLAHIKEFDVAYSKQQFIVREKSQNYFSAYGITASWMAALARYEKIIKFYHQLMNQEIEEGPNTFPVYSQEFVQRPQVVLEHSQKMKKQMDDFIHAFSKRIDAENAYQKHLMECAKLLEKYIDPTSQKCVSYICSAFKVDNQQRGKQARDISETLKTEVVTPMTEASKHYSELIKKSQKSLKKLTKDYNNYSDVLKRSYQNYKQNDEQAKDFMITKYIFEHTTEYPAEKKNKLIKNTTEGIKEKMNYEKVYRLSVGQYNQIVDTFTRDTTEILNELQNSERQLVKMESDALRKLIVAEVSMFKNVQYDLMNITRQMQKMYPEKDIQTFKSETSAHCPEEPKDLGFKTVEADMSLLGISLRNAEEGYYPWLISVKKNTELRSVIETRMKQLLFPHKIEDKEKEQKKEELEKEVETKKEQKCEIVQKEEKKEDASKQSTQQSDHPAPLKQQHPDTKIDQIQGSKKQQLGKNCEVKKIEKIWQQLPNQLFHPPLFPPLQSKYIFKQFILITQIINGVWMNKQSLNQQKIQILTHGFKESQLLRIMTFMFIEEYRIEQNVGLEWENYQSAVQLIRLIINLCEQAGDTFTIKGILNLLFTFAGKKDEHNKRIMYQENQISSCWIWKRDDFWLASLFESTFEETYEITPQKGQTAADTLLRQKNLIFNQLASHCHYMLMLGVSSKDVRLIVGRFCRLYDTSDEQNKDLSRMISNISRQLRESALLESAHQA